ncbi:hypothetical protein RR46_09120 [Papilio xuthus]|uniref:Uncharacterized protein n=1 Tax=Papilio xuthus TaxID=66420 RepID=A0A194PW39_PAPXU|nr:hypothetical protein RR46_09120 [Papilio xuthus]
MEDRPNKEIGRAGRVGRCTPKLQQARLSDYKRVSNFREVVIYALGVKYVFMSVDTIPKLLRCTRARYRVPTYAQTVGTSYRALGFAKLLHVVPTASKISSKKKEIIVFKIKRHDDAVGICPEREQLVYRKETASYLRRIMKIFRTNCPIVRVLAARGAHLVADRFTCIILSNLFLWYTGTVPGFFSSCSTGYN